MAPPGTAARSTSTGCCAVLASIYGIDIDPENVTDSRRRMHAVIATHVGDTASRTDGFWSAVDAILTTNIVRADTLADAQVIELVSYQPGADGTFVREWSTLEEAATDSQLDLFDVLPDEPQRDEIPVHYAQLAANPKPLAAKGKGDDEGSEPAIRPPCPRHSRLPGTTFQRPGPHPTQSGAGDARHPSAPRVEQAQLPLA